MNYNYSRYIKYASTELRWLENSIDNKNNYAKNIKHQYTKMAELGWNTRKVTYKFNSDGFRAPEFNINDSGIMFIGCSHTMGVGVPYELTWANIVATKLGLTNWNIGQGGGSMDICFRLGAYWISKLKPKLIVLLIPEKTRLELVTKDRKQYDYTSITLGTWSNDFLTTNSFYSKWLSNDINAEQNSLKNELALRYIANTYNIKFISESYSKFYHDIEPGEFNARDLSHKGITANQKWADIMLNTIESQ